MRLCDDDDDETDAVGSRGRKKAAEVARFRRLNGGRTAKTAPLYIAPRLLRERKGGKTAAF